MSKRIPRIILVVAAVLVCVGETRSIWAQSVNSRLLDVLNVGTVEPVEVVASGIGGTESEALLVALDRAITQVNGRRVNSNSIVASAGLEIEIGSLSTSIASGSAMGSYIESNSDGAVLSYRIISATQITETQTEIELEGIGNTNLGGWLIGGPDGNLALDIGKGAWRVEITAEIAKYRDAFLQKPKLVVRSFDASNTNLDFSDTLFSEENVISYANEIFLDSLVRSNRFDVLGREYSADIQSEIDFINSNSSRLNDQARLGQQFAADAILVIRDFSARFLPVESRMSVGDASLLHYEGEATISIALLDPVSSRIISTESLSALIGPTSRSTRRNTEEANQVLNSTLGSLLDSAVTNILVRTFPVSVVRLDGNNVVLNQGYPLVKAGEQYEAYFLGEELIDPLSGLNLGNEEIYCCTIRVDRASELISNGTIDSEIDANVPEFEPGKIKLGSRIFADEYAFEIEESSMESDLPQIDTPLIDESNSIQRDNNW